MVEKRKRRPDIEIAARRNLERKIDIIKRDFQIGRVQAADFLENGFFHHQARAGHCRNVRWELKTSKITGSSLLALIKKCPAPPPYPKDASMLYAPSG